MGNTALELGKLYMYLLLYVNDSVLLYENEGQLLITLPTVNKVCMKFI